eukprot:SAG31_NODE_1339_length_8727_cov_6.433125_6_plen_142_part_00
MTAALLSSLLMLGSPLAVAQFGMPAYCPLSQLQSCKGSLEKCQPFVWHGIDSLELFEMQPLNQSAVLVRSLNGSFEDTVATITVLPKTGGAAVPGVSDGDAPAARNDPNRSQRPQPVELRRSAAHLHQVRQLHHHHIGVLL